MAKWLGLLLVIVLAATAAFYLLVLRPQQAALALAEQAASVCAQQLASLRGEVADLTIIRDQLQRSGAELAEKEAEKEKELLALRSTQDELVSELKSEIADKTVQVERIRDQLRVDLVDEVLFDSGEATLKPAGIAVFGKIGAVLAKSADRRVEVQGHTDNVPITGARPPTACCRRSDGGSRFGPPTAPCCPAPQSPTDDVLRAACASRTASGPRRIQPILSARNRPVRSASPRRGRSGLPGRVRKPLM